MSDNGFWRELIDGMKQAVTALEADTISVAEMPDAAGRLHEIERRLAVLRRRWNAEQIEAANDPESEVGMSVLAPEPGRFGTVRPKVVGTEFRTVTTRSAKRTFNVAAILAGASKAWDADIATTIRRLLAERVVKIDVRWSELDRLAKREGLPMRVVDHEVDDDDVTGAWVGEVWTTRTKQEPITGGSENG